ncbi:MAG: shikimate kinase [Gammaproteobacteria bacterium]|nr:shikimate kinase [Gammaproteobacteria bacterium]
MMKSKKDNIYLIGPMGAGKTTIGKKLSRKLEMRFFDSDREVEKTTGATINLIFDVEGEPGFREWESRTIEILMKEDNIVLATGGGAILSEANRKLLKKNGLVIYLEAGPELIMKRTAYDNNRPLLATKDKLKTITDMLNKRNPVYEQVSDFKVNVDKKSTSRVINEICTLIEEK